MQSPHQHKAAREAIERIREKAELKPAAYYTGSILQGDRTVLSQAITIIESTSELHTDLAREIISGCLSYSGKSIRIGITGVPGVGKSTFIEALGLHLISKKKKVAVLAIDPSSPLSKGSILGDKTRMENLSMTSEAFIRPSPASTTLGGVARKTRESIILCEAAGFDVILVETVGVGQSETAVYDMTDFFLLLMLAGAGDQLQGIKRGIMEMCDSILITKADGNNAMAAARAGSEYYSALHLFPPKDTGWIPRVEVCSALENKGIDNAWEIILSHEKWMKERGLFLSHRNSQDLGWMHDTIKASVLGNFFSNGKNKVELARAEQMLKEGAISPFQAAERVLKNSFPQG